MLTETQQLGILLVTPAVVVPGFVIGFFAYKRRSLGVRGTVGLAAAWLTYAAGAVLIAPPTQSNAMQFAIAYMVAGVFFGSAAVAVLAVITWLWCVFRNP